MKTTYTLDQIDHIVSKYLLELQQKHRIFTLTGPLGVGKTTLMKRWLAANGVHDEILSPTFTYVNIYRNEKNESFFHFDLYRLSSHADFVAMGFTQYLGQPRSWCFIEWPEVIEPILSNAALNRATCHIELSYNESVYDERIITVKVPGINR